MAPSLLSESPLHCTVCPLRPLFSDVSHLLTHISSKGHLSQYYKLKIHANQDLNSKDAIDAYDSWYAAFGIEQLISERMQMKEKNKPRRRSGAVPAMEERPISKPSYRPRLHLWSTINPNTFKAEALEYPGYLQNIPFDQNRGFAAPVAQMRYSTPEDNTATSSHNPSGVAKLKGANWPGMDIFDAATPEMKRKRNQKKNTSVAVQLERHSLLSHPTELIFTPSGSFRKARVISGQPEFNSSPDKLTSPITQPKRRRSNRPALTSKDVNAPVKLSESPTLFSGYGPAIAQDKGTLDPRPKSEQDLDNFDGGTHQGVGLSSTSSGTLRHLTSGFYLTPYPPGLETRPGAPSTLLDLNTGTLYHSNFVTGNSSPYYSYAYYG